MTHPIKPLLDRITDPAVVQKLIHEFAWRILRYLCNNRYFNVASCGI
jgi:hypothetical protein